jgi:hypothetical protein
MLSRPAEHGEPRPPGVQSYFLRVRAAAPGGGDLGALSRCAACTHPAPATSQSGSGSPVAALRTALAQMKVETMLACSDGHHPSGGGGGGGRLGRSSSVVVATPPTARPIAPNIQKITPRTAKMPPITQRITLLKIAARMRQMTPTVIKLCLNGDQVVPPMFGELVSRDSIRRAADRPAERCIRLRRAVRARCQGVGRARRWGDRSQTPAAYSDSPAASRADFAYCCIASTFLPTRSIVFCHSAVGLNSTDSASSRAS